MKHLLLWLFEKSIVLALAVLACAAFIGTLGVLIAGVAALFAVIFFVKKMYTYLNPVNVEPSACASEIDEGWYQSQPKLKDLKNNLALSDTQQKEKKEV